MSKWLVRSLVLAVAGALVCAGGLYHYLTNPSAIRLRVVEKLAEEFVGASVSLGSASLRVFGGIAIHDLRLARRDDRDRHDFFYVPSAVLYHDKEKLAQGKLALRKIEMHRPRLRLIRDAAGHWNLDGITGPSSPDDLFPTLIIRHGTLIVEDRQAADGTAPLELTDVNLIVMNDPKPMLSIEGSVASELLGTVQLEARRHRRTEETTASILAPSITVGPGLVQRIAAYCPELADHARQLEGMARIQASVVHKPGAENPLRHDVHLRLVRGKFRHDQIPLPLEDIEATLHLIDGQIPEAAVSARSGAARMSLGVKDLDPCGGVRLADLVRELDLQANNVPVTPAFFGHLPRGIRTEMLELQHDFDPRGTASMNFSFRREDSGKWRKHAVIRASDGQCRFFKFPYPVRSLAGTIELDLRSDPTQDVIKLDMRGDASGQPIFIKGDLTGDSPAAVAVDIWGEAVPLNQPLVEALPPKYQALAREFHPVGSGSFKANLRRRQGSREFDNRYVVTFEDCRVKYDVFPYPLEQVTGVLDIRPNDWEFRDFVGRHNGGEFRIDGRSTPLADGRDRIDLRFRGQQILLDQEMAAALEPEPDLKQTWRTFTPSGRIDFEGTAVKLPDEAPDIDLTVWPKGCRIYPTFFPYALEDLRGKVRYARRWVEVDKVTARHGNSRVALESGNIYLKPGGGAWAELLDLRCDPLLPTTDFLQALPPAVQKACLALRLKDPVAMRTHLVIDSPGEPGKLPVVYWDGRARLRDASFTAGLALEKVTGELACRGRHDGTQLEGVTGNLVLDELTILKQPLRNVRTTLHVSPESPETLRFPGIQAEFCGGTIYGPLRVELGPMLRYEARLTASQVKLEEFAKYNLSKTSAELSGLAYANIYLEGTGPDLAGLSGSGSVQVPKGKIGNLPLLLDLLKVIGLRPPDRTMFEEAHADFELRGQRVTVHRLDLFGNVISLRGAGTVTLDPSALDLDFHAEWARLSQVLPPGLDRIPPAITNQLLTIKMRGSFDRPQITKEPVPALLDPLKRMLQGTAN